MAKPHPYAWNGIDIETALPIEHVSNMAHRAASESQGNADQGRHRIVATNSTDREMIFRVNDFAAAFNKFMIFNVTFAPHGGRVYVTSTIDWYMTEQESSGGFIPKRAKIMVAHHTYMQFCYNLAQQVQSADRTAIVTVREGEHGQTRPTAQPHTSPLHATTPPPSPPRMAPMPAPSIVPISRTDPAAAGTPWAAPATVAPVPVPGPPSQPVPTVPTPPWAPPPQEAAAPQSAPIPALPPMPSLPPSPPVAASTPVPSLTISLSAKAQAAYDEDEELHETVMKQAAHARGWQLTFSDGQVLTVDQGVAIGRDPVAEPGMRPLRVGDPWRSLSKTHASIHEQDGLLWVTDLHSTNGTTVANSVGEATACAPGFAMPVGDGWTVTLGEVVIGAKLQE